jgi:hypothetical protein
VCVGAIVHPTFLVDGFVAGMWDVKDGDLLLRPFGPLPEAVMAELAEEGARLLAFAGAAGGSVTWRPAGLRPAA